MANNGAHETNVDATTTRMVQGVVDGAIIRTNRTLTVQGHFTGDLVIEPEGILVVQGLFSPGAVDNEGTIFVTGLADVAPEDRDSMGQYCMSPGSLTATGGAPLLLQTDGSESPLLEPQKSLDTDGGVFAYWTPSEHRWMTMAELRALNDAAEPE